MRDSLYLFNTNENDDMNAIGKISHTVANEMDNISMFAYLIL